MPREYARVRLQNGSHVTVAKSYADLMGLHVLKQDAVGLDGRPLPPKHRADLGTASAAKSPAKSATSPAAAKSSADESQED